MPNKFLDWVDDSNINNTQTYEDFENDEQRKQGFKSGTAASSIRVNTALRQANLVANAIMDVVAPDDSALNFKSKRNDIATKIKAGLGNFSIQNSDGTYSKFTKDENGVLKVADIIVPQKKVIAKNLNIKSQAITAESRALFLTLPNITLSPNKHYVLEGSWSATGHSASSTIIANSNFVYDLYTKTGSNIRPATCMNVKAEILIVENGSSGNSFMSNINVYVEPRSLESSSFNSLAFIEASEEDKQDRTTTKYAAFASANEIILDNIYEIIE